MARRSEGQLTAGIRSGGRRESFEKLVELFAQLFTAIRLVLVNPVLGTIADERKPLDVAERQKASMRPRPLDQREVFCPTLTDPFATRTNCFRASADETRG